MTKATLETEKLPGGALDDELPQRLKTPFPAAGMKARLCPSPLLASWGQMPQPKPAEALHTPCHRLWALPAALLPSAFTTHPCLRACPLLGLPPLTPVCRHDCLFPAGTSLSLGQKP